MRIHISESMKGPTLRDDVLLEVTNLSHYEQMMRSQIGDNDDAYQALQDVKGEK